jgi:hypothetical protein
MISEQWIFLRRIIRKAGITLTLGQFSGAPRLFIAWPVEFLDFRWPAGRQGRNSQLRLRPQSAIPNRENLRPFTLLPTGSDPKTKWVFWVWLASLIDFDVFFPILVLPLAKKRRSESPDVNP